MPALLINTSTGCLRDATVDSMDETEDTSNATALARPPLEIMEEETTCASCKGNIRHNNLMVFAGQRFCHQYTNTAACKTPPNLSSRRNWFLCVSTGKGH